MTTVRISDLTVRPDGIRTAIVTTDGSDPVLVDDSTGAWTFPLDPAMPPNARCARRVVRGWCVELLNGAVNTGQPQSTVIAREAPVLRAKRKTTIDEIAQRMAKAGARALKEAA